VAIGFNDLKGFNFCFHDFSLILIHILGQSLILHSAQQWLGSSAPIQ
jgi:hypothetical protein